MDVNHLGGFTAKIHCNILGYLIECPSEQAYMPVAEANFQKVT